MEQNKLIFISTIPLVVRGLRKVLKRYVIKGCYDRHVDNTNDPIHLQETVRMNVQYNSLLCIDNIGLQLIIEIN